jgi:Carbohydrate-binding module 48 (Isoamylase N-terminal domain)
MRDRDGERLIHSVARELRKPVPLSPDLEDQVRRRIRGTRPKPFRRAFISLPAALALAAGLAVLAVGIDWKGGPGTEGVEFVLDAPDASRVTLVGDFNNWDPTATPLIRVSSSGRWEAVVPLDPGRYEFTFVVDGNRWVADPALPHAMGDDFGRPSSVITVVKSSRS